MILKTEKGRGGSIFRGPRFKKENDNFVAVREASLTALTDHLKMCAYRCTTTNAIIMAFTVFSYY